MRNVGKRLRQTMLLLAFCLGAGLAQANCDAIKNVRGLTDLGWKMMADPASTYSITSARGLAALHSRIERRKLRKMLDAQYKSIHFPEIMNYFAKLNELSKIIRLYGNREMRRYVQREKLELQSVKFHQLIEGLCALQASNAARTSTDLISTSQLISNSYARKKTVTEGPGSRSPSWQILFVALFAVLTFGALSLTLIVQRARPSHTLPKACWVPALLRRADMLISGHLSALDAQRCAFVCNPMQRHAARAALGGEMPLVIEVGDDMFEMRLAESEASPTPDAEFHFRHQLEPDMIKAMLKRSGEPSAA